MKRLSLLLLALAALLAACTSNDAGSLANKIGARWCQEQSPPEAYVCRMPNGKYRCYWSGQRVEMCKISPARHRRRKH